MQWSLRVGLIKLMPCPLEIKFIFPDITVEHYFNRAIILMVVQTFNYTKPLILSLDHDRNNPDLMYILYSSIAVMLLFIILC